MISIEVDIISYNGLIDDLKNYGKAAIKAIKRAIDFTGLRVETIAKQRLRGEFGSRKHWVTGRLASSVHYESQRKNHFKAGVNSEPEDGNLNETIGDLECVIGTNVDYGPKIEFEYDRFLGYAAEMGEKIFEQRIITELNKIEINSMMKDIEAKFDES